jgi:hypothetical protein
MTAQWSRAEAERVLGPDVMAAIRELVKEAPPLTPEQREQMRALFATARPQRALRSRPAADAA